jgi:RNA polymerase sigma-70 factor (ECF subfamily)
MTLDTTDDARLVRLIADGREDALEALYDRYSRLVFSVALAVLQDRALAEEATLDVFVRAWQRAATYRSERAKVSTWLAAITRHHAIDILRWQRSHAPEKNMDDGPAELMEVREHRGDDPDPEQGAEAAIRAERVRAALDGLPDAQRRAVVLSFFKGYSHSEIAARLGQPLGTVKTHIHSAMKRLRLALAEEEQPSPTSSKT